MLKKYIPNLFTFLNLIFGLLSISESFKNNFSLAAVFIILAALVDRYDGRIARFFSVCSELGKELDSLADLISFGVAPAILIFTKYNFTSITTIDALGICILLLYVICGAYRLARYNTIKFNGVFSGIPITIAGFVLALFSLFVPINSIYKFTLSILQIVLSYLMISKLQFKKV